MTTTTNTNNTPSVPTSTHDLMDYDSATIIRDATQAEIDASDEAINGVIEIEGRKAYTELK